MSFRNPDDRIFEFPQQNTDFDAEVMYDERPKNRSGCSTGGCCGGGCCLGCFGFLLLIAFGCAAVYYSIFTGGAPLVVSPETTIIVGPLKPDGTVDFHQAIQTMVEPDVQPDENGFMTVWRGYGREIYDSIDRATLRQPYLGMCDRFGIDPLAPPTWADENAGLDAVQIAAAQPHYFIPAARVNDTDLVIASQPIAIYAFHEQLADSLRQRASLRFDADDTTGAWNDMLTASRLFRRVTVNQAWLKKLSSKESESQLTPVDSIIKTLPKWTPQQLEQGVKDLESLPDWQDRKTMFTTIQFMMLDTLSVTNDFSRLGERLHMDLPEDIYNMLHILQYVGFDWNLVAKELNTKMQAYEALLQRVEGDSLEEQLKQLRLHPVGEAYRMPGEPDWEQEWQGFMEEHFRETGENPLRARGWSKTIGAMLGELGNMSAGEMVRLQLIEESRCQALRLALTLEQFRRAENRYPDSLAELDVQPSMNLQYEKQGNGYRIWNAVYDVSVDRN